MKKDDATTAAMVVGALIVPTVVCSMLLRGWVFSKLWLWFAVSLGAPPLGIARCIGLSIIVTLLTYNPRGKDDREGTEITINAFFLPLFGLLFGWIASLFL